MAQETLWYAVLAAFFFSAAAIVDRFILRDTKDVATYGFISFLGAALLGTVFLVVTPRAWETGANGWFFALLASLMWGLYQIAWFKTDTMVDASLKAPFRLLNVAFSLLLASLFLGEKFTLISGVSFVLILLGTGISSFREKWPKHIGWLDSGIILLLLGALFATFGSFFDKKVVSAFDVMAYMVVNWVVTALVVALNAPVRLKEAKRLLSKKLIFVIARSVFEFLAYFTWLLSYTHATYGSVMLVIQLIIPFTFVGGVFLLGERNNLKLRTIGAAVAMAGGILVALYA